MVSNHKIKEMLLVVMLGISGFISFLIAKSLTGNSDSGMFAEQSLFTPTFLTTFIISFVIIVSILAAIFFAIFKNIGGGKRQNESDVLNWKNVEKEQRRMRNFYFYPSNSKAFHKEKNGLLVSKNMKITSKNANEHTLVIAPTGGGKTATMVIPSLIHIDDCSLVITDPKGELYDKTAKMLRKKGYKPAHLSFLPQKRGNIGYNLLAMCKTDDEIRELATALMISAVQGRDDQWARLAMTYVLMFMYRNWKDASGKLLNRTINDVFDEMTSSPSDITQLELDYFSNVYPAAVYNFKQFAKTANAEQYISSILATVQEKLAVFSMDIMKQVSEATFFDPGWMRQHKIALYISYPPNRAELYMPFLSAFYYQLFAKLQDHESVDESIGRNDGLQIHFILDEFANAGKIPAFNNLLTTIRSKKMAVEIFIQSLAQLQLVYGKIESTVILENCKTKCVLPGTTQETAEFFSKLTGEKAFHSTSVSYGNGISTSVSEQMRRVMSPNDIRTMDKEKVLVISDNIKPFMDDREFYYLNNFQFWLNFRLFRALRLPQSISDKFLKYFEGKKKL